MKLEALTIVIVAMLTAGCGGSGKKVSAKRAGLLVSAGDVRLAAQSADDDFDLLEEELDDQKVHVSDPLKPLNRMMYHLNDRLYYWVLRPLTNAYKAMLPKPARSGIRNFFHNLTTPVRFVNCLLQGKKSAAGKELYRFAINTTEGVLGLGDPARTRRGLEPTNEDLGQTLGKHGMGNGIYIVLPLLGPSTFRDALGLVGDQFLNPVRYVKPRKDSIAITVVRVTNDKSFQTGEYESFKETAFEPYVAIREAYIQYRAKQVKQ